MKKFYHKSIPGRIPYAMLFAAFVLLSACSDDDGNPITTPTVDEPTPTLQSFEVMESKTATENAAFLESQGIVLPFSNGYTLYRITYETLDIAGATTLVSGVVSIPDVPDVEWSLLSYQHGTIIDRDDVISVIGITPGGDGMVAAGGPALGFVTAIPDYIGLGISQTLHPYVHAATLGRTVVDILRAARELCDSVNVTLNDKLFLMGYSEGGYATMAAHKLIEADFAEEFSITASAPMAGPYDVSGIMYDIMISTDPYPSPSYFPYVILTFNAIGNHYDPLSEIFVEPLDQTIPVLFDGTQGRSTIEPQLPSVPAEMLNPTEMADIIAQPDHPVRVYLRENDLYDWTPQSTMRMYHCPLDEIVPFENSELALETFQANGATDVELIEVDGTSHEDCALPTILAAALWFRTL